MHRIGLLTAAAALLAAGSTAAGTDRVRPRVSPQAALAGEHITISARVTPPGRRCSARITRPGAKALTLPRRKATRGKVSWKWVLPMSARGGRGAAKVTCAGAGSKSARFRIRPLPQGDPLLGKTVFLLYCGGCHTLADAGTVGTSVDLDPLAPTYARTVDRVVNGRKLMPSFKARLSPKEIADVSAYVASAAGG